MDNSLRKIDIFIMLPTILLIPLYCEVLGSLNHFPGHSACSLIFHVFSMTLKLILIN